MAEFTKLEAYKGYFALKLILNCSSPKLIIQGQFLHQYIKENLG